MSASRNHCRRITAADVIQWVGGVPTHRIRCHPAPGTATADDAARVSAETGLPCELAAGVIVERAVADTLTGGSVLPGFAVPVARIFEMPRAFAEEEREEEKGMSQADRPTDRHFNRWRPDPVVNTSE